MRESTPAGLSAPIGRSPARLAGLSSVLPAALFIGFLAHAFTNPLLRIVLFLDNVFYNYLRPDQLAGIVVSCAVLAGVFTWARCALRSAWAGAMLFGGAMLLARPIAAATAALLGGPALQPLEWQDLAGDWFRGFLLFSGLALAGARLIPVLLGSLAARVLSAFLWYSLLAGPGTIFRLSLFTFVQLGVSGLLFGAIVYPGLRRQAEMVSKASGLLPAGTETACKAAPHSA